MGEVLDRALADPAVLGAVAAVALLAVVMVFVPAVRGLRWRREPEQVVAWVPVPEPDESEPYAAELLREMGKPHLIEKPYRGRLPW